MRIKVEIAPGELIDKLTILEVKLQMIEDGEKRRHAQNEFDTLNKSALVLTEWIVNQGQPKKIESFQYCTNELKIVNHMIWDVLQIQRDLENSSNFDDEHTQQQFIEVSLQVYHLNDRRALLKRTINNLFNTDIAEVKEYK